MASSSFAAEAALIYDGLITPHIFGTLIASLLSGALLGQLVVFYTSSESRRPIDVYIVLALAVSSLGQVAVEWWSIYNLTVAHVGDIDYPMIWHAAEFLIPTMSTITTTASQIWFVERAWRTVGKSKVYLFSNLAPIVISAGAALAVTIVGLDTHGTDVNSYMTLHRLTVLWLWSGGVADVLATSVLCWKARGIAFGRVGGRRRQPSGVQVLIRLAFMTGSITTATALAAGAAYMISHTYSTAFLPFALSLPRLAALSCLVTINVRSYWKGRSPAEVAAPVKRIQSAESTLDSTPSAAEDCKIELGSPREGSLAVLGNTPALRYHGGVPFLSEIGSNGDLERALWNFQRVDTERGLSPAVITVPCIATEEFDAFEHAFERPRRPSFGPKKSSGGVIVQSSVLVQVDDHAPSAHKPVPGTVTKQ